MRRRLLLITILAPLLLGSAHAEGEPDSLLANTTLTCSARLPAAVVGCFVERPIAVLGPVELALGVDAQVALSDAHRGHLAPYAVLAWYADQWSAWAELRLPELAGLHPIGDPDFLRLGFSLRFN